MKLYVRILICLFGLLVFVFLLIASLKSNSPFFEKVAEILAMTNPNILENGDFHDDLNGWKYDENISVIKTNKTRCVHISGISQKQVRLYQNINVVSGQTYNLTFNFSGPPKIAFIIYRDVKSGKELYFLCNGSKDNQYKWVIKPTSTGKNLLFLSTKGEGDFYYSNIKLKKNGGIPLFIYIFIAVLSILLITRFNASFFVFALFLALVPVLKITGEAKSISENRTLEKYKPLFGKARKINVNYGSNFDSWINDHFWLRNDFMKKQNSLKFLIDGKVDNKFVSQGLDKWFFLKENLRRLAKPESYYNGIYDETVSAIKRFNSFCEENGAKLYIIVAPFGEELYNSEVVGADISKKAGLFGRYIESLNQDTDAKIIYAYKALEKAKLKGLVQYKTDHHWTEFGAYNVYRVIREVIFKDFNITQAYQTAFKTRKKKYDFGYGETFNRTSNISKAFARRIYPYDAEYLKFTPEKSLVINDDGSHIINESGINKKIFLFGDSYTRNIKFFFGYDFANTRYQEKSLQISMPYFEKQISKYKPEIVVMIIYSQNYNLIKNWYK